LTLRGDFAQSDSNENNRRDPLNKKGLSMKSHKYGNMKKTKKY
jgi:hypothetical protein